MKSNDNTQQASANINLFLELVRHKEIDVDMTEKIKNHIKQKNANVLELDKKRDKGFLIFQKFYSEYFKLIHCDDIKNSYNFNIYDVDKASQILDYFNIKSDKYSNNYISFKLKPSNCYINYCERDCEYVIFIFSNTVLVFVNFIDTDYEFLCALFPNAIEMYYSKQIIDNTVTIREISSEPIEHYKQFNPCPDSNLKSFYWEITNKDGGRSFRGGLKPENNPLHFKSEYGVVSIKIGEISNSLKFSNAELAYNCVNIYNEYIENKLFLNYKNQDENKQKLYLEKAIKTLKKLSLISHKSRKLNRKSLFSLICIGVAFVIFLIYLFITKLN